MISCQSVSLSGELEGARSVSGVTVGSSCELRTPIWAFECAPVPKRTGGGGSAAPSHGRCYMQRKHGRGREGRAGEWAGRTCMVVQSPTNPGLLALRPGHHLPSDYHAYKKCPP